MIFYTTRKLSTDYRLPKDDWTVVRVTPHFLLIHPVSDVHPHCRHVRTSRCFNICVLVAHSLGPVLYKTVEIYKCTGKHLNSLNKISKAHQFKSKVIVKTWDMLWWTSDQNKYEEKHLSTHKSTSLHVQLAVALAKVVYVFSNFIISKGIM